MERSSPLSAALLTDGHAGNLRQASALAEALGCHAVPIALQPDRRARLLAPRLFPGAQPSLGAAFAPALAAPPPLAIGCGRQGALATRLLRTAGSRVVQILDPRIDPRHWDLVIVPEHDRLRGDNVLTLLGSLHPVDDAWLERARAAAPQPAALPAPRTLVLIGGPTRHAPLDDASLAATLAALQAQVRADGGSLTLVGSRRTPEHWRAMIAGIDAALPGLRWRDERDGPNPHAGLLAWADRIVCTPDSVNMLSEAAATSAPLQVIAPDCVQGRLRRFLDTLRERGRIHAVGTAWQDGPAKPLRETTRVANEVAQRLRLR